jgi:hypothetical protein
MLGTGARYAEYGITGGFFLLTQALILGFAAPDVLVSGARSFGVLLTKSVGEIPNEARPAIQSLLVALALLSVFIIGLVLEIIGSVFMLQEANLFRKRLAMNQWVAKFVEAELPDYAKDYRLVLDAPDFLSRLKKVWKPKNCFRGYEVWRVWRPFRRLESALIAKVLTSGAKTEMLAEQISIYRMSRAIGTALYIVSLEFFFVIGESSHQPPLRVRELILYCAMLITIGCATLITLGAYSRFANMLLSLVYASWKPQTAPLAERTTL